MVCDVHSRSDHQIISSAAALTVGRCEMAKITGALRGTRDRSCMQLHPPAPCADVQKEGWGLLWQRRCWWKGCREWEGNLYNYNLSFGVGGVGGGCCWGANPLDVSGCTPPCWSLHKIHPTPFNTKAVIQMMWHREQHLSYLLWLMAAAVFYGVTPLSKGVLKRFFFFFLVLLVSETKAAYREDDLHNEKLSEDVIPFNDGNF